MIAHDISDDVWCRILSEFLYPFEKCVLCRVSSHFRALSLKTDEWRFCLDNVCVIWEKHFLHFNDGDSIGSFYKIDEAHKRSMLFFLVKQRDLVRLLTKHHRKRYDLTLRSLKKGVSVDLSGQRQIPFHGQRESLMVNAWISDVITSRFAKIQSLNLDHSHIDDPFLIRFANGLEHGNLESLKRLTLNRNAMITDESVSILIESVALHCINLQHLELGSLSITNQICSEFRKLFKQKPMIKIQGIWLTRNRSIDLFGIRDLNSIYNDDVDTKFYLFGLQKHKNMKKEALSAFDDRIVF